MDLKIAFLNGDLKQNVYMTQPKGFVVKGQEHKVCKLIKSLYGLKQAPCAWFEKLTEYLLKLNFKYYKLNDATLFVKKFGNTIVYLVVYVDNLLITGNNERYIASVKEELKKGFEMIYMGLLHYSLGVEVNQIQSYSFISQKKYIRELLNRFGMEDYHPLYTPMEQNLKLKLVEENQFEDATKFKQLIGSLIYLTTTIPNISFMIGILSQFMHTTYEGHLLVVKRVI